VRSPVSMRRAARRTSAVTVWLMYGCGLRIGEALAVKTRSRINKGTTLRVREQVNPVAELKPLKFRVEGQSRDIPLPLYVSEAIDKHIASHGTTDDGYLFQGRRHKHVTRRTYNEDFERAAGKAGLPPEFIPHTLRHCFASISQVSRIASGASFGRSRGHALPAAQRAALRRARGGDGRSGLRDLRCHRLAA
jgi:integrase